MNELNSNQQAWLNKLSQEINKRIAISDFSIEDLVQPMRTSRTRLYEQIKTLTGLTPSQYIQELRTLKAHGLIMSNTYNSIYQIVHAVGLKRLADLEVSYYKIFNISPVDLFEKLWGERLKQTILKNLERDNYTVEDLVFDMKLDRKQLYARTKRVTGTSPGRYIRQLKLEKAKNMVEDGQTNSVKDIAASIGFQRTDYFSNLYEEYYNYRPSDYKK